MITAIKSKLKINTQTCASKLVDTLVDLGVDSVFGYPGAVILSIYNELSKTDKITHYLVRHEQAALHMAEGYARVNGKAGVVLVTSGPGFTNTITGIANAYADSTPLVVLVGDVSSNNPNAKIFQKVDICSMVKTCTKKCYKLKQGDDIKQVLIEAFNIAGTDKKGPVVLSLSRSFLESEFFNTKKNANKSNVQKTINKQDIEKLYKLINNAKSPLILVGGGSVNASEKVKMFAEKLKCPVVSTLMGIGIYPSESELYLGMIGMNGTYLANSALNKCDLLISLGSAFSDRSTCKNSDFSKKTRIVSINIESVLQECELNIVADMNNFLDEFIKADKEITEHNNWLKQIDTIKSESYNPETKSEKLHSSFVLKTISEYTKQYEPIVVTDVGQHQMLTAQFFNFNKPRKFITSGGMGTMGFGLPASIGCHIANPNNLILNITGDGSFQMNLQELATCREHNIPVKIIIMNNGYLGMVRQLQEKIYNSRYQVEMTNPDFVKIAEAYDLFAIRVTKKDELFSALNKAIAHKGTAIIDIMIDSFEEI